MESVDDFEEFIKNYDQTHASTTNNNNGSPVLVTSDPRSNINTNVPKLINCTVTSNQPNTSNPTFRTTMATSSSAANMYTSSTSKVTTKALTKTKTDLTSATTPNLVKRSVSQVTSTEELQKKIKLEPTESKLTCSLTSSVSLGMVQNGIPLSVVQRESVIVPASKPGTSSPKLPAIVPLVPAIPPSASKGTPKMAPLSNSTIVPPSTLTVPPVVASTAAPPNPPTVPATRPSRRAILLHRVPGLPPNIIPLPPAIMETLRSALLSGNLRSVPSYPLQNSSPTVSSSAAASSPNGPNPPTTCSSQITPQYTPPPPTNSTTPIFQHVTQRAYEMLKLISPSQFPDTFLEAGFFKADILEPHQPEYSNILEYIVNSQAHNTFGMDILSVLKVTRPVTTSSSPAPRFKMMLWHGTKPTRVASILKDGFKCPQSGTQMFGKGVYFADRISKSAQYCNPNLYCAIPRPGEIGYLFLCEVTLGKCYNAKNVRRSYRGAPTATRYDGSVMTFDSIKCTGENIPDRQQQKEIDGVIWPLGRTIRNTRFPTYTVLYNEFIVYDPEMVKVKYLVKVQFK